MATLTEEGTLIQVVKREPQGWESITLQNGDVVSGRPSAVIYAYRADEDGTTYAPRTVADDPNDPHPIFSLAATFGQVILFLGTGETFTQLSDDGSRQEVPHPFAEALKALNLIGVAPIDAGKVLVNMTRAHREQVAAEHAKAEAQAAAELTAAREAAEAQARRDFAELQAKINAEEAKP